MAMMFNVALQRFANGEHSQVMPVTFKKQGSDNEAPRNIEGFELQWMERLGIDPEDSILCRYRIRDPEDVKRMKEAFGKKQAIQTLAKN